MDARRVAALIEKHLLFWNRRNDAPLVAFTIGAGTDSWSYWRDNKATAALWGRGAIRPQDLVPAEFVEDQRRYLNISEQVPDDAIRTAMPFASMPWLEAIAGCPVISTEAHFAAKPALLTPADGEKIRFDPGNEWVRKYVEFLHVFAAAFGEQHPVAQSVLRGPSDLAGALLGTEAALEGLLLEPEAMQSLFARIECLLAEFIRHQMKHIPSFHGGHVIGQYEIWAPGTVQRMQEDGASLYSPALYRRFLKPLDARLAEVADYTLIHLHTPALNLIDDMLDIPGIRLFQVTKDEGPARVEPMLPGLRKVQAAGRCLIIKGRLNAEDIGALRSGLEPRGLCIQPVVNSADDANRMLENLRRW
jgi:hypothetical protein